MQTADEMFEDLGYKKTYNNFYENDDFGTTIDFLDSFGKIEIKGTIFVSDLQAINKKCKELGWIE